jgi:hypothetical protein
VKILLKTQREWHKCTLLGLDLQQRLRLWPVGEYQGQWLLITTAHSEKNRSLKGEEKAANTKATMRSGPVTSTVDLSPHQFRIHQNGTC